MSCQSQQKEHGPSDCCQYPGNFCGHVLFPDPYTENETGHDHGRSNCESDRTRGIPEMSCVSDAQSRQPEIDSDEEQGPGPTALLFGGWLPQTISLEDTKKYDEQRIHTLTLNNYTTNHPLVYHQSSCKHVRSFTETNYDPNQTHVNPEKARPCESPTTLASLPQTFTLKPSGMLSLKSWRS